MSSAADLIEFCKCTYPLHTFLLADIDKSGLAQLEGGTFDYVVAAAVSLYLEEPVGVLSRLRKFIRKNGSLIVTTPHSTGRGIYMMCSRFGFLSREPDINSVKFFGRKDLHGMASAAGYDVSAYYRSLCGLNQLAVMVPL